MATATIVKVWKDPAGMSAYMSAVVAEGGQAGTVEYIASTPLVDANGTSLNLTTAQVKANLTAAIAARRNAQVGSNVDLGTITGLITV